MDNASYGSTNKKILSYSTSFSHKIRPILTLAVLIAFSLASYRFGLKIGAEKLFDNNSSLEGASKVDDSNVQPVTDSDIVVSNKTTLIVKNLGIFNNEEYFLEWSEIWPVDRDGVFIKKGFIPLSYSASTLKKNSLEDKTVIVGENIKMGSEYTLTDGVVGVTSDYSSVILSLNCVSCDNSFMVLNLISGRVMNNTDLVNSMKVRNKSNNCLQLSLDNFIQDNLLFVCTSQNSEEVLYKYHLATYVPSEVEVLKENETFSCGPVAENQGGFLSNYKVKEDEIVISVCSKNAEAGVGEAADKIIREIKVKDI